MISRMGHSLCSNAPCVYEEDDMSHLIMITANGDFLFLTVSCTIWDLAPTTQGPANLLVGLVLWERY